MYTVLFMPTYATRQLGLPASGGFLASLLTGAIQLVLIPIVGALSDRHRPAPDRFRLGGGNPACDLSDVCVAGGGADDSNTADRPGHHRRSTAGYMGGLPALMSELFPTRMRTTGLSISYSFGVAIFGGFAPFINAWLIAVTGSKLAPSFYLMLAAAISLAPWSRRAGSGTDDVDMTTN